MPVTDNRPGEGHDKEGEAPGMSTTVHGKNKKRRPGVHKHRHSPETQVWNQEHLVPEKPAWMTAEVYHRLVQIRNGETHERAS